MNPEDNGAFCSRRHKTLGTTQKPKVSSNLPSAGAPSPTPAFRIVVCPSYPNRWSSPTSKYLCPKAYELEPYHLGEYPPWKFGLLWPRLFWAGWSFSTVYEPTWNQRMEIIGFQQHWLCFSSLSRNSTVKKLHHFEHHRLLFFLVCKMWTSFRPLGEGGGS